MSVATAPLTDLAARLESRAGRSDPLVLDGRLVRVQGPIIRATMDEARIGEECVLADNDGTPRMRAEVVGLDGDEVILAPGGDPQGLSTRTRVIRTGEAPRAPVGEALVGRVVDAFGRPLDGGTPIEASGDLNRAAPDAMSRPPIDAPLSTGIRAIDGFLTLGVGQRVGLFGSAGTGKSTLLASIIRSASADRIVLGLIGERGREVAEFLERDLGPVGRERAAVVVATSDRPASERLRAALAATAAAEAFRDAGHSVLLLIDSATRIARATREIGLAAGEPSVRRGFPPSTLLCCRALSNGQGGRRKGRSPHSIRSSSKETMMMPIRWPMSFARCSMGTSFCLAILGGGGITRPSTYCGPPVVL